MAAQERRLGIGSTVPSLQGCARVGLGLFKSLQVTMSSDT